MTAKIEKSTSTRTIVDTSGLRLRDCNRRWMPLDLAYVPIAQDSIEHYRLVVAYGQISVQAYSRDRLLASMTGDAVCICRNVADSGMSITVARPHKEDAGFPDALAGQDVTAEDLADCLGDCECFAGAD